MSQTKIDMSNLSDSVVSALSVPKISAVLYPGNDTAASTAGGQTLSINGSGFASGAVVLLDGQTISVVSVISGTQIQFTSPAKATGSYSLVVINTDGGTATFTQGIQYSGTPNWSTPSGSLATVYETMPISATVSASSDSNIIYTVASGTLPVGALLNSTTGAISGNANTVSGSTTYSFVLQAEDAEKQETNRNFSITVNPDVVTWSSPAEGTTYTANLNQSLSISLSATSAAGKSITYTANSLPTGLTLTGSSISGTVTNSGSSSSLITATAATTLKTANRTLNFTVIGLPGSSWTYKSNLSTQISDERISLTYFSGAVVGAVNGRSFYSTDSGNSWTVSAYSSSMVQVENTGNQIAASPTKVLIAGGKPGAGGIYVMGQSSVGGAWTQSYYENRATYITGITYVNSRFFVYGWYRALLVSANDGTSWTDLTTNLTSSGVNANLEVTGIVWTGTKYVLSGYVGASYQYTQFWTSTDLVTWTYVTQINLSSSVFSLANNGNVIVGPPTGSTSHAYSTDGGTTWNTGTIPYGIYRRIIWNGTQFLAAGDDGVVVTSTDGITWTNRTTSLTSTGYGVTRVWTSTWTGSGYVVAGSSCKVATSP